MFITTYIVSNIYIIDFNIIKLFSIGGMSMIDISLIEQHVTHVINRLCIFKEDF